MPQSGNPLRISIAAYNVPPGPDYQTPTAYADLPRVTFDVDPATKFADVLDEGERRLADTTTPWHYDRHGGPHTFALRHHGSLEHEPVVWPERRAGFLYGVRSNGELVLDNLTNSAFTLGDLARADASGYLTGEWDGVVLLPVGEWGGNGAFISNVVSFLGDVGVNIVANGGWVLLMIPWRRAREAARDRLVRKTAQRWHASNITTPVKLRIWIETKKVWQPSEVAQRLKIPQRGAKQLLTALGYEHHDGVGAWIPGVSKKALRRRTRWEANERETFHRYGL